MARLGEVPFSPLLRQRRRDAAVRHADRRVLRAYRRSRRRSEPCGPTSRRHCSGSTPTAIPTAMGFVEYQRQSVTGLSNQGWKDSARRDLPRRMARWPKARSPCARCRAMSMPAKRHAAQLARALGRAGDGGAASMQQAEKLRQKFEAAFWCEELSTYALALDGAETALPGHRLECRACAVDRDRRARRARAGRRHAAAASAAFPAGASAPWRCLGGALQPDVVSQRLGLAARQCA